MALAWTIWFNLPWFGGIRCDATGDARTDGSAGGSKISRYFDTMSTDMKYTMASDRNCACFVSSWNIRFLWKYKHNTTTIWHREWLYKFHFFFTLFFFWSDFYLDLFIYYYWFLFALIGFYKFCDQSTDLSNKNIILNRIDRNKKKEEQRKKRVSIFGKWNNCVFFVWCVLLFFFAFLPIRIGTFGITYHITVNDGTQSIYVHILQ